MPSDRIDKLLEFIESLSEPYATLSSELSATIEQIEKRLLSLPGKVEYEVSNGDSEYLAFDKSTGDWGLHFRVARDEYELKSSPMAIKMAAATLMLPLLEGIGNELDQRVRVLNSVAGVAERLKVDGRQARKNGGAS